MSSIFVLQHESENHAGDIDAKFIGVFSSRRKAEAAVQRLRSEIGFSQSPDGFSVDTYDLDHVHWAEGFVGK